MAPRTLIKALTWTNREGTGQRRKVKMLEVHVKDGGRQKRGRRTGARFADSSHVAKEDMNQDKREWGQSRAILGI